MTKLGVQIFTTPSISLELVQKYHFLTHLLAIEFTYFTAEGHIGRPLFVNPLLSFNGARDQDDSDSWKPDVRVMDIQEDVHHLLGNEAVRWMIPKQRNWLMQFLDFFQLFQGMHAQKRETIQHREYESNAWEIAHNITAPITRLMGYLSDGFGHSTREELQWALQSALAVAYRRCSGSDIEQYPYNDPVQPVRWHQVWGANVIDFKVADDYVSLYYPLNWMVSLLVTKIVEFDRDAPTDWGWWVPIDVHVPNWELQSPAFFQGPHSLRNVLILTCVDYPLRANVFCSQIKAKLWTRNGLVMIKQYYVYNITYAHSRSCSDFTFLQWAFAILPAETMLISMLDRYDLVEQLTNPSSNGQHQVYHDDSLKVMIEEFFQMFLNLMNERNAALGESTEDIVRREIAHRLIFKKLSYSDLLRQVRQYIEVDCDDHFDRILKEMANFHPPTEVQAGAYELKSEYYSLVDPHHRSYTRNQAVECERVLVNLMSSGGVPEPNRVIEPQNRVLKRIHGPFAGLTKVLGTKMFARVIFCALRFAIATPSETILDQATFLCFIAVMSQDTQLDFVSNAQLPLASDDSPSLVHALLATLVQPQFTTLHAKVRRLLSRMKAVDPVGFGSVPQVNLALSGVEDALAKADAEQKKLLAKKRQLEALNRMKLAQSKFQASHQALLSESDSDTDDFEQIDRMEIDDGPHIQFFQYPKGTCILCQEETSDANPYGVLAMIHQNPISRVTPLTDEYFIEEVALTPPNLDVAHQRPAGQANWHSTRSIVDSENKRKNLTEKILGKGFPKKTGDYGLTVTTCGHLLHHRCWQSYFKSVQNRLFNVPRNPPENSDAGELLCPLCRALSNVIIPIVWNEGCNHQVSGPVWSDLSLKNCLTWLGAFKEDSSRFDEAQAFKNLQLGLQGDQTESSFVGGSFSIGRTYNSEFSGSKGDMYKRLLARFREHQAVSMSRAVDQDWDSFAVLLAGTITSMEIAQRGTGDDIEHELSPPVLGALSAQDLTLLRILAKSVQTVLRYQMNIEGKKVWSDFYARYLNRVTQLCPFGENIGQGTKLPSLLQSDMFERFVVASAVIPFTFGLSVGNLLLIHYVAEITKITMAILASKTAVTFIRNSKICLTEGVPCGSRSLLIFFVSKSGMTPSETLLSGLYHLLQRFILPFLRKAIVFVHVFRKVLFPKVVAAGDCESVRLCRLLGLPSLTEILDMDTSVNNTLFAMIRNWISWWQKDHSDSNILRLEHPAIFEVIGLPKRLDTLLELASKFRCPKCHLVPDEPAMCLLCGDIICTQAICCERNGTGEMNLHREQFEFLQSAH